MLVFITLNNGEKFSERYVGHAGREGKFFCIYDKQNRPKHCIALNEISVIHFNYIDVDEDWDDDDEDESEIEYSFNWLEDFKKMTPEDQEELGNFIQDWIKNFGKVKEEENFEDDEGIGKFGRSGLFKVTKGDLAWRAQMKKEDEEE